MYICSKCNYSSDNSVRFCPWCGNVMNEHKVCSTTPNKSNLAKKIVGMALSIDGFVFSVCCAYLNIVSVCSITSTSHFLSLTISVFFSLFRLPLSIIGLSFSKEALNLGDTSKISSTGKKLGIAGLILWAVSYAISIFILFL